MKLASPSLMMHMIWLVPMLVLFCIWAGRKKRRLMEKFAQKNVWEGIVPDHGKDHGVLRALLNIAAVFFIILAIARPQWGFFWGEERDKTLDVMFALDTSRSMLAEDILPNRLEFARSNLRDLVKQLRGDRVGLIAFAGSAFVQCPLTDDHRGFLMALDNTDTNSIPRGGTSLPSAIQEAIRSYSSAQAPVRLMVIITDGENTEGDIVKAVNDAKKAGITISCVGIGGPEGQTVPVRDDKGNLTLLRDSGGNIVRSRLMEDVLKMVARETGGIYVRATQSDPGLRKIYDSLARDRGEVRPAGDTRKKIYKERFQFPLGIALLLLMSEFILRGKNAPKKP